jgi:O-antigen ligase
MFWLITYLRNLLNIFRTERKFSYIKPNSLYILVYHCFIHLAFTSVLIWFINARVNTNVIIYVK